MRVGDRHRKRISCIRAGNLHARQQTRDHGVHLSLLRSASPDHCLLHQPRRIFPHLDARLHGSKQNHAPRLPQLQRRLWIGVDEHLLDRSAIGRVTGDDVGQFVVEDLQPVGQRRCSVGPDLPVGDMAQAIAIRHDHAPAGCAETGVQTDEDQDSPSLAREGSSEINPISPSPLRARHNCPTPPERHHHRRAHRAA